MRIGFDASVASGQPGGTGTYAVQLLGAMVPLRPDWTFYLYFREMREPNPLLTVPDQANVVRVPLPRRPNVARIQVALPSRLDRDQIDLYHSPGYFLPLRWQGKKIVTIHDLNIYAQARNWLRRGKLLAWADLSLQTPLAAWRARRIIVDSTPAKHDVVRWLHVDGRRIDVIPLAPDPYFDQPPSADDVVAAGEVTGGRPFILFVGVLSPQKNLEGLIRAFAAARIVAQGVRLVIAGADHEGYASELQVLARELGVDADVVLAGYVSRPTLRALYATTLSVVQPSHGEGFGLPMVEAMASGAPVLAANRQALPEVLGSGGQLFDPDDVTELSGLLERVSQDGAFRAELKQRAAARRHDFSWVKTAQATAAVYEQVRRER